MREIEFRAWHPEEKKMWLNVGTDGYGGIVFDTEHMGLKPLKGEATLMQYTGLKDKNGKEIYEGDVVRARSKYIDAVYVVYWEARSCQFRCYSPKSGKQYDKTHDMLWADEVIGNIYENPELLEVE